MAPHGPSPRLLADAVARIHDHRLRGDATVPVTDVVYRSTESGPGALFCCIRGAKLDGHDFASDALARGAVALLVERWLPLDVAQVLVPSVRAAIGPVAAEVFGRPGDRLTMIGITGTNGKTTTSFLLESVVRASGAKPGVIGTTGVRVDGRASSLPRTTPEAPDLQRLLATMVAEDVGAVAMEVSSHGLHQHRVDGIRFGAAVFTNLSQDHLDYHASMREYFDAKARLFTRAMADVGVVNHDSAEGRRIAEPGLPTITYGIDDGADVRATDVRTDVEGIRFVIDGRYEIRSSLRGLFNVENCLAAFATATALGIDPGAAVRGIEAVRGVPGRVETVEEGQPFLVMVDYAHTPEGIRNVLSAARPLAVGRVIVVFGCGGDRDRSKRPLMGEAATSLADLTVITSDNPRSEEPSAIIDDIEPGAKAGGGAYVLEADRRAAIRYAVRQAVDGDVVVIAGKGHESGQEFADRTIAFSDRDVAAEELRALRGEA